MHINIQQNPGYPDIKHKRAEKDSTVVDVVR